MVILGESIVTVGGWSIWRSCTAVGDHCSRIFHVFYYFNWIWWVILVQLGIIRKLQQVLYPFIWFHEQCVTAQNLGEWKMRWVRLGWVWLDPCSTHPNSTHLLTHIQPITHINPPKPNPRSQTAHLPPLLTINLWMYSSCQHESFSTWLA